MTNAEKYLKDGVDILDFACEIEKANQLGEIDESICATTCRWLNQETKSTLTEEVLRYEFLSDWLETADKEEIIQKLIQNDERAKKLKKIEEYTRNIVDDETYKADWLYDVNGTQVRRDLEELLK